MATPRDYTGYLFSSVQLPFSDPMAAGLAGEHVRADGTDPAAFGFGIHTMLTPDNNPQDVPATPASMTSDLVGKVTDSVLGTLKGAGVTIAGVVLGSALVALGLYAFAKG